MSVQVLKITYPRARTSLVLPAVDEIINAWLAYLRLRGCDAMAHLTGKTVAARFDYNDRELDEITHRAMDLSRRADEVHVVFNNNSRDYAPKAAERLQKKLGQLTRPDRSKMPRPPSQGTLF